MQGSNPCPSFSFSPDIVRENLSFRFRMNCIDSSYKTHSRFNRNQNIYNSILNSMRNLSILESDDPINNKISLNCSNRKWKRWRELECRHEIFSVRARIFVCPTVDRNDRARGSVTAQSAHAILAKFHRDTTICRRESNCDTKHLTVQR